MAYNIQYDPKALKQFQKLDKPTAILILEGIENFATTPILAKIKKLKTPFDGAYCVIFYLEEDLVLISKIVHRKDVYL